MFSKFDEDVRKILVGAKKEMKLLKHPYVGTEHLLLSILKRENSVSNRLKDYNITYSSFKKEVINILGVGQKESEWFVYTPLLKRILESSSLLSKEKNFKEVSLSFLFSSFLSEGEGVAFRILLSLGVDLDSLYDEFSSVNLRKNKKKLLIDEYGVDLNKSVSLEFDPVIGRDEEVSRVIEILCRKCKNNPILIGEAGVGKTAIVEELSNRIVNGDVPFKLLNKRIVSVSMATLVSGTKYRGEFEERITKILKEVEDANDIIIFIDEIHTLVGAGGAEGAIDASNILKPALARGKINVIGATTTLEYKKTIEKDKALSRRFQPVFVLEPDLDKTYNILLSLKPIYEKYHSVTISDSIIKLIVDLSNKYLYNQKQPDKAIDVLDEVCSKVSISGNDDLKNCTKYKKQLKNIIVQKNSAIINNCFDEAIKLREKENEIESIINSLDINITNKTKMCEITDVDVAEVIKSKSNIPVFEINRNFDMINIIKDRLNREVIGQKEAVDVLCDFSKKIFCGIRRKRPYSFLFVGPTGVGKTYLVKKFSEALFNKDNLIRVDMTEYKEANSVSKIIGSPPGYVGFDNKSSFLESVKEKPYSVILLDEIEKAHTDVINLFLQILDDGKIKDSTGEVFHFENSIIIMTSNAGCNSKNIGFNGDNESSIEKYFSLEFLNRLDKTIIFNSLNCDDIKLISKNIINSYMKDIGCKFNISSSDIDSFIEKSEYKKYGARRLERIIINYIDYKYYEKLNCKMLVNSKA